MFIVTGANGFIGSALIWELNHAGIQDIVAVDRVAPSKRPDYLRHLNTTEFVPHSELFQLLQARANKVTSIFHMGAASSTTETDEEFLRENNTEYSKKLFAFCRDASIPYIYASSGAVYGAGEQGFSDRTKAEDLSPLNPYGWSKLNFDKWAMQQQHTPPRWYGLRFFNVFGPNEYHKGPMASMVYKAFQQIRDSGTLKLFRSHHPNYEHGLQKRDFVYVKDITRWMLELYQNEKVNSGVYNMGFGKARTWLDLARSVFKNMNREVQINWMDIPEDIRSHYQYFTEADISKLMEQGISKPQWPLEQAIEDYVSNYLLAENEYLKSTELVT